MAGEQQVSLGVEPTAVTWLYSHLEQQGRLKGRTPPAVQKRLLATVSANSKGKNLKFEDAKGGGIVVGIASGFDDEALYAVLRKKGDQFVVTEVIDEDVAIGMVKGMSNAANPEGLTPEQVAAGADPSTPFLQQEVVRLQEELRAAQAQTTKLTPKPDDPALVRHRVKTDDSDAEEWFPASMKVSEVSAAVQGLLAQGIKPEDIEVWTGRRQPKVRVELE
jgi:hypothetical protein